MKTKISWCATSSREDKRSIQETIDSIDSQTIKPYEKIITYGGNISQGRNKYLKKIGGDFVATFDGGCIYQKDYSKKLIESLKKNNTDIAVASVRPFPPKNKIQEFCIGRMPDYDDFTNKDWKNFIPSNRQVIFRKKIIKNLGLLPEELWRSDDTYWFQKAKKIGLKFSYCPDAIVSWEMKTSLKSYLKTVYNDTKCDYQFGIPPYGASKRTKQKLTPYSFGIMILAGFAKIMGIISGKLNLKKKIEL